MGSLPSPPFIDIPGISNFRDIGYVDGEHVRKGFVYRSADPSKATAEGMKKMQEKLGIKTIFDLRSTPEIKRDGPEWAGLEVDKEDVFEPYGIDRVWNPVFAEEDYGPDQVAIRYRDYTNHGSEGFVRAYQEILHSGTGAYGKIFRYLAQPDASPCLINCTAGKDRTGILIAVLLTLAGVSADKTADEYALTDAGLADLKPFFVDRLLRNPALEGNSDGVWRMVSSKKENMIAALNMVSAEFGSAEEYIKNNCGLTDSEVEQIKKNLVQNGS